MSFGESAASLIGRETETRRLTDMIDRVHDQGGSLLVRGEAGIGKSALLATATTLATTRGLKVLTATGVQSEALLPYAGLHQLLHPLQSHAATLPPPQREPLRAAFGLTDATVPDLYLVALATLNLLAEATTSQGTLLVVDDAHWLDQASAQVLTFVARRLESEPVLLLAAVRDGFPTVLDDAGLPDLPLTGIPPTSAETLLDATSPGLTPRTRQRVLHEAAGNPLALTELPRAWQDLDGDAMLRTSWLPLTTRLEKTFTSQVARLPEATRTLLLVAAVNDTTLLTETLSAAAHLTPGSTDQDLTPAVAARLVATDHGRIVFRHPLMRSAIYQSATLAERHAAHAAIAGTLAELSAGNPGDLADRETWHRAAASPRPDDEVAASLDTMAARAQQKGVATVAVSALEQAARLSHDPRRRAERLLRAADVSVELGNHDVVTRLLRQTEPLDLTPQQRTRVLWIKGAFDDGTGDHAVGPLALAELAETVAAEGDPERALRILWSAALRCFWVEPGQQARDRVVAAAESLPIDPHHPQLLAILAYTAPIDRGGAVIDGLRTVTSQPVVDPQAARLLGTAAVLVGALDLAERLSAAALTGLRSNGRLQLLARALCAQAWSAVLLLDLDVAIPAVHEAKLLSKETGQPLMYATALSTESLLQAVRGDRDHALTLAAEAEKLSLTATVRPVLATVQMARGMAALAEGKYAEAYDHLARMHDPADPSHHISIRCHVLAVLADAAAHSGNTAEARAVLADMETVARTTPSPALHAGLLLARPLLSDDPEPLFEQALASDAVRWPFNRAHTQLAYGEWLRRDRRAPQAKALLRAARETFDALGAVPWSERARRQLRSSGERSEQRPIGARDMLTAQEFQIVQMVAEGMTNREIGQRLYVSHRTIGAHLYRIFPKLGITSRAELGAILSDR
ncbi:LuxR family transcriptional regulator [Sphaerisporangium rubeum]|uniref:DNA-binding CsgD family transcriptional regulator n=1 Tax=Sphaerisporangium rubeum TaxID=321317 RepID=A0A7X0IIW3_9ACTN|nr:LuxR family transcriptional regulator [Sphaerisporangium rubeum]MBB6474823.1 DNA-binding CsgD family transcriptional regulator [Sphaerisporangium rubeum]